MINLTTEWDIIYETSYRTSFLGLLGLAVTPFAMPPWHAALIGIMGTVVVQLFRIGLEKISSAETPGVNKTQATHVSETRPQLIRY